VKKTLAVFALALIALAPKAGAKERDEYQDAKFVGVEFAREDGFDCKGESCMPHSIMWYRIASGGYTFMLQKADDLWSTHGILSAAVPEGTPLKIRFSKNHEKVYVRFGKKESSYLLVPGTVLQ
jgi:hypothetical protein